MRGRTPDDGGPAHAVHLAWGPLAAVHGSVAAWMTPAECTLLAALTVPKRAADWRLGRWLAKEAVGDALGGRLTRRDIEVLPTPGGGPRAGVAAPGSWPGVSLSLSHAGGMGLAAAAVGSFRLGCDVEQVVGRSDAFVTDYFTERESAWIRSDPDEAHLRANLLWSAKESALKALGKGLRLDTRTVEVQMASIAEAATGWGHLTVTEPGGGSLPGRWCAALGFVWTVVADAPFGPVGGPDGRLAMLGGPRPPDAPH